jgi:FHS family L-fucose permease-like MFS transporter
MDAEIKKKPGLVLKELLLPFILVTTLFFMWGIPNNLNGVLIKQFMKAMELSRFQAGLIQSAFYLGYFMLAVPAGILMRRYSYKTGIVAGLLLYASGCILFWPAAIIGHYWFFLLSLFVIASGLAFLETGANPFIALSGDPESSEKRLNFSQAFNPIGSITGVLIGTIFIFSGIEPDDSKINAMKLSGVYESFLRNETMRVVKPYLFLSVFALLWAVVIIKVKFPGFDTEKTNKSESRGNFRELLSLSHFWKGVLAQFFYVGAQVGTWSYFIPYVQDYTNQPEKIAGYFLTGTLAAFGVGRFSATWFMHYLKPNLLMGIYSIVNVMLTATCILFPGWVGMWAIFLTSFFMSLMYPTIFATSIKGLGENTKIGGSILVMAIIGGALCTPLMGYIAEKTGSMAVAMIVPLIAYIYISYYSLAETRKNQL